LGPDVYARSQNGEERLLASRCPSVRLHETTHLPPDGFPWNFIFGTFKKICRENTNLVQFGQKYQAFYIKT